MCSSSCLRSSFSVTMLSLLSMNWEASEIVEQDGDKFKRWIKESICIRSNTPTMNRDEGAYQLSPIWTQVISTPKPGGSGRLQSDFAHLSQ